MQFLMVMWLVWGALIVLFAIIKIYVMGLSRDEDDQLVLQEGSSHVQTEQAVIVAKLNKVQPVQTTVMWLIGAMTLFVIGYYVMDIVRQFQ